MPRPPGAVRAAGGVLWQQSDGGPVLVAVVHRPRYDDWSLPKGKLEPGETEAAAAVREIREETGFDAVLGRGLGSTGYPVLVQGREVPKTVRWWAARVRSGSFVPGDEVDALRWLPVDEAAALLTAGSGDGVLPRFAAAPASACTLLLVRHGRAGDPARWHGDDGSRPLDDTGRRQAEALAGLLPLWAPQAVLTAPPLRCRQTVGPLADRLGLPCTVDETLGESGAPALTGRLRELAAAGRDLVVCSQGGVIPAAVAELAEQDGLDLGRVRAPKGSLWALTFADGRLVDADLTSDPLG